MSQKALSPQERSAAARARLLAAANELFYADGVQSVGIDRVIAHAGVAKATLYSAFGSKDGLIRAYLQAQHTAFAEHIQRELEVRYDTPKERLIGVLEVRGLGFTDPTFRGCPFINARAEAQPGGVIEQAVHDFRTWLHELFFDLAQQAGAKDAKLLARQLVLLLDGAVTSAWVDRDPSAATTAGTIAAILVDAAIPA